MILMLSQILHKTFLAAGVPEPLKKSSKTKATSKVEKWISKNIFLMTKITSLYFKNEPSKDL